MQAIHKKFLIQNPEKFRKCCLLDFGTVPKRKFDCIINEKKQKCIFYNLITINVHKSTYTLERVFFFRSSLVFYPDLCNSRIKLKSVFITDDKMLLFSLFTSIRNVLNLCHQFSVNEKCSNSLLTY